MIETNIELNAPETELDYVHSVEQLGAILEALGIIQPMFRPNKSGEDAAGVVLPMLIPGPALEDDHSKQVWTEFNISGGDFADPIDALANPEVIARVEEVFGHIRPELLDAWAQHPVLGGLGPNPGKGAGADLGFMADRDGFADNPFDQSMVMEGGSTTRTLVVFGSSDSHYKTTITSTVNADGSGHTEARTVDTDGNIRIFSIRSEDEHGTFTQVETRYDADGTYQGGETQTGTYDREAGTYQIKQREPIPSVEEGDGPDSQPNDAAPTPYGGVFDPEAWTDPRLHADQRGAVDHETPPDFAARFELTWQEALALDVMKVTNPGLALAGKLKTDSFVFITPEIGPDGQSGPDPEGPGPIYDASAAAPKLASGFSAQVVGDFPVDTVDPDDGLIGGPVILDAFGF
ncbi:MAG: hypothetical protein AAGA70_14090 [Pseudomonadota bacterium]